MELPFTSSKGVVMKKAILGRDGLLCREGTYDIEVAKEIRKCYASLPVQRKIVLDIGGNIGGFARYAALSGASLVIAIEPEESNFKCMVENTKGLNVKCIRGCLDHEDGNTQIYISDGINAGNTTQTPRRGRFEQSVPKVSISRILNEYKPESIKIDCEGAEYNIGRAGIWPAFVKNVCGELHISGFGYEKALAYSKEYEGWRALISPKITQTNWHTIFSYDRSK
jgi:FkbM family methyltransferase